jgi:C-terminal processing protease CtpA/Prc
MQQEPNGVRPSVFRVVFLLFIGLFGLETWQWRTNSSLQKENLRLQEQLGMFDAAKPESLVIEAQRDQLLRAQHTESQQIQFLSAEVQQLRDHTNELGLKHIAQTHQTARLALENETLRRKALLAKNEQPRHIGGWLGVTIRDLHETDVTQNASNGVVILAVQEPSPAARSRLQTGDIIVSVDSQAAEGTAGLKRMMAEKVSGQPVVLDIARRDTLLRIELIPDWGQ